MAILLCMMTQEEIRYLQKSLNKIEENYADSFRTDILFFIGDLNVENTYLKFLWDLNSIEEIENWIVKLTSRIVMKEGQEEVNEIIHDYVEFG